MSCCGRGVVFIGVVFLYKRIEEGIGFGFWGNWVSIFCISWVLLLKMLVIEVLVV